MRPLPVLALLALATMAACERRRAAEPAGGGACSVRLPDEDAELPEPPAAELPKSHISVGVQLAVDRLRRELGRHVPATLASARGQDIGAAGEVSYRVRRGGFDVRLDGDRLLVSTPVTADVEVCKPLGPFCPTYGRCSPRLVSTASVPLLLDGDYAVGKSRVSIALTKPCVIAGMDVSSEIRRMAHAQAGGVQRRIDGAAPELRPMVEAAWKQLFVPVALGASTCLRIAPERLAQSRPALANGTLSSRLAVIGALRVDAPCDLKSADTPTPLPALAVDDALPADVALEVPMRIDWSEVGAELTRSLATQQSATGLRVAKTTARGSRVDGRAVIALDVTVDGTTCGQARLLAEPRWDAEASRVRLTNVSLAPGQPERSRLLAGSGIDRLVTERAAIALPLDVSGAPTALEGLVERLAKERPDGVDVTVEVQPARVDRVLVAPEGLVPVASFRGGAAVRVR